MWGKTDFSKERSIDCDFSHPDFGVLTQSFGVNHYRVEAEADLTGGINLIEILLDKNAFPSYLSAR